MVIEKAIRDRIWSLINESHQLAVGNQNDQCVDPLQKASCSGWLTSAQNAVHLIIGQPNSPYRKKTDYIAEKKHGYCLHHAVRELSLILINLLRDVDAGLISSIADQTRAEVFDDFLDQADYYLEKNKKNEAGVIAGVVFEDSVRRICKKLSITEKGQKLDSLISELAKRSEITGLEAKRGRVAADVRTKATHAQWDEFQPGDVDATFKITRELIETKLK